MKNERNEVQEINGELVLTPERKLKDFGPVGTDWKKWKTELGWYEIYYSPSTIEFDGDDEMCLAHPDVLYVVYDTYRKQVVHLGNFLGEDMDEYGMGEYSMNKLYEGSVCVEDFTEYIIRNYGREMNI